MSNYEKIDAYIDKNLSKSLDELNRYVAQPSISAQNLGLKECAQIVKEMLEKRGFKSTVMATDGAPVVFGERKGKTDKTILIYNDYDVQPPEPLELWDSPPFDLDSLVAQTLGEFEVIVCDDGSTDKTATVVEEYVSALDIVYDYAENFGGPARPRNRGVRLARAAYVAFLDSDDWWAPAKLERSVCALNAGADVVFHDLWNVLSEDQKVFRARLRTSRPVPPMLESLLCSAHSVPNSSIVVRRGTLRAIGETCEDRELIAVEDLDLLLRLSKVTEKFVKIPECLGYYGNGGGNISRASSEQIRRIEAVYARHLPGLGESGRLRAEALLA